MKNVFLVLFVMLFVFQASSDAQSLSFYGFAQLKSSYSQNKLTGTDDKLVANATIQQANFFVYNQFNSVFSGFVNFEFTDSYNSSEKWGTFALQELYVKADHSRALKIKFGQLLPKFGYMSDIYNRTPLLPYITRPILFEKSYWGIINKDAFLPQRANVQVSGSVDINNFEIEYSAFWGSPASDYIHKEEFNEDGLGVPGTEKAKYKTYGGRVGFVHEHFTIGLSGTLDKENFSDRPIAINPDETMTLGDLTRYRFAIDAMINFEGLTVNGEYIGVRYNLSETQEVQLKKWSDMFYIGDDNLNKYFVYGTANYEFSDKYNAFISYSNYADNISANTSIENGGLKTYHIGFGFKPVEQIFLKTSLVRYQLDFKSGEFETNIAQVAASISF